MNKEEPFMKQFLQKIWEYQNNVKHEESSKTSISDGQIKQAQVRMDAWVIPGKRKSPTRPNKVDLRRQKEEPNDIDPGNTKPD